MRERRTRGRVQGRGREEPNSDGADAPRAITRKYPHIGKVFHPAIAASTRVDTPNFPKMEITWDFTVLSAIDSC